SEATISERVRRPLGRCRPDPAVAPRGDAAGDTTKPRARRCSPRRWPPRPHVPAPPLAQPTQLSRTLSASSAQATQPKAWPSRVTPRVCRRTAGNRSVEKLAVRPVASRRVCATLDWPWEWVPWEWILSGADARRATSPGLRGPAVHCPGARRNRDGARRVGRLRSQLGRTARAQRAGTVVG